MRLLICLLFLFPYQVFGQTPLSYQDIIAVNGVEKDQLYIMARRWFSDHFKKMDAVLDINDKETGEMTAKFKIAYHSSIKKGSDCSKGYINARLSLLFKDGKVKYKLSDFRHDPTPDLRNCIVTYDFGLITNGTAPRIKHGWGKKWSENVWQEMQEVVSINASYIKSSLIEYFKLGHKSDEW